MLESDDYKGVCYWGPLLEYAISSDSLMHIPQHISVVLCEQIFSGGHCLSVSEGEEEEEEEVEEEELLVRM